jgi:simple sugar transport system ATP-binding protein
MSASPAVRMLGIIRRFGSVQALRGAALQVERGEVHAVLGENGAGKTTLLHVLFGLVRPDAGRIELDGRPVRLASPAAAIRHGIGMVHQHFTQVPTMTVAENAALGLRGVCYDPRAAAAAVERIAAVTGLSLDPAARAEDLPVGLRQRLEIVKALVREVRVLVLDEPTAALAPREVDDLFAALRRLAANGVAVVLVTHKLREVPAVADRVTVLRAGRTVLTAAARDVSAGRLAQAMVGETTADVFAEALETAGVGSAAAGGPPVIRVSGLRVEGRGARPTVDGVTFEVRSGEIVGVAAVEGNGQRELLRAVAGVVPHAGIVAAERPAFIPEDRQLEGLVLDFSVAENLALGGLRGVRLRRSAMAAAASDAIRVFDIRAEGPEQVVRELSGGNQQKVVLARVLARRPQVLIAENPTRGLDLQATAEVHGQLRRAAREDGVAVLFSSTDLDEVLALADRVAVMVGGRWRSVEGAERTRERVGALMLGAAA